MSVTVQIVDPRSDTEPSGWKDFRRRQVLQPVWDYDLLRVEAWLARNPPVLAVIRDGHRVVGALAVMLCRTWRGRSFAPPGRDRGARLRWAEAYLPLLSGYPACVLHDELDARSRTEAVRCVETELKRYVGAGLLGVVYRAMTDDVVPALSGPGRVVREIDPTAVLANRWSSESGWLRSLDRETREQVARVRDRDLEVSTGTARTDLDFAELANLLNEHRARQDHKAWLAGQRSRLAGLHLDTRSPVPTGYLARLIARQDVVTRTYRDSDGTLLGFNAMIDHPVSSAVHFWAAAPRRERGLRELHLDAYAHAVHRVIDAGRPELTAGRTLLAAKARLGFGTRTLTSIAVPRPVLGR
jgi:hypothetical protein